MVERPYNNAGWRYTGKKRIRNRVFLFWEFAVLERLVEYQDGSKKWVSDWGDIENFPDVKVG